MACDADAATNGTTAADAGASGDADATGDGGVIADVNVVGHLDLIVELDAIADHRVLDGPSVHGGIGADLNVIADDHGPDLRYLNPTPRVIGQAKTVGSNHHARMQYTACPDDTISANENLRNETTADPDTRSGHDHATRTDDYLVRDQTGRADDGVRPNAGGPGYFSIRRHHGGFMHPRLCPFGGMKQRGRLRKSNMGIIHDQRRHRTLLRPFRSEKHGPGPRAAQRSQMPWPKHECKGCGSRRVQGSDPLESPISATLNAGAQCLCNFRNSSAHALPQDAVGRA